MGVYLLSSFINLHSSPYSQKHKRTPTRINMKLVKDSNQNDRSVAPKNKDRSSVGNFLICLIYDTGELMEGRLELIKCVAQASKKDLKL